MTQRRLRLLSANIQAGSSTRGYHDYVARSWSHVLPAGNKRGGFAYWSHQPNRRMGGVVSSANGLLSKFEPREVVNHALPGRVRGRGVLLATFGNGADALSVAVAHLSLGAQSRRSQVDFIAELLGDHPHAVLMGDFNCDPDRPEMQALYRHTRLQPPATCVPTFPSWKPRRAIDHVLVTPALRVAMMQAMPAALSDHLALSVELDVPERAFE